MMEFLSLKIKSFLKLMSCKQTPMEIYLMVFGKLAEFDEDAAGGFGMQKGDFRVVSTRSGFLIDQCGSLLKIGLHLCLNIIDLKTDVMDPWALGF